MEMMEIQNLEVSEEGFKEYLLKALDDPQVQEKILELVVECVEADEYSEFGGEMRGWHLFISRRRKRDSGES